MQHAYNTFSFHSTSFYTHQFVCAIVKGGKTSFIPRTREEIQCLLEKRAEMKCIVPLVSVNVAGDVQSKLNITFESVLREKKINKEAIDMKRKNNLILDKTHFRCCYSASRHKLSYINARSSMAIGHSSYCPYSLHISFMITEIIRWLYIHYI